VVALCHEAIGGMPVPVLDLADPASQVRERSNL